MANFMAHSGGIAPGTMRVFGRYALVYVVAGGGTYRDARRVRRDISAGDLITVLPELAHQYGPTRGGRWDEYHLIFDGPLFNLWRRAGWLDETRLVRRLEPVEEWAARFQEFSDSPRALDSGGQAREIASLQILLSDILATNAAPQNSVPDWLQRACNALELNLELPYDGEAVARAAGLSYENFRKAFARVVGASPSRYRAARVMDAACALMQHGNLTNAEIARRLGFADEGHFSKRFKSVTGQTPREFRQSLRAPTEQTLG
ncbi:MAG TPA: AraC family transcriptional regulator [Abditibacteriaceae bacterium]